jgi:hypothetical protein
MPYTAANIETVCVSLYYYSVHISHQASPFSFLCVAFALDFFPLFQNNIKSYSTDKKSETQERWKKVPS